MRLIFIALVMAGCAVRQPSTITANGVTVTADDGRVSVVYEYPMCLIESKEKGAVKIELDTAPQGRTGGFSLTLLSIIARLINLF